MSIDAIDDLDRISSFGPMQTDRVSLNSMADEEAELIRKTMAQRDKIHDLAEVQSNLSNRSVANFPNLAMESIKAGLAKHDLINVALNRHIDEIQASHQQIAQLLDLTAELGNLKEESTDLSEKAKEIIANLKNSGVELQGKTVGDYKRLVSSHESRIRSDIQIKFTTKIQHLMTQSESLIQILHKICNDDTKLKEHINQRQTTR